MIQEIRREQFQKAYGILCRSVYPHSTMATPFGSTWCVIEPAGATLPHFHHEGETFFVLKGEGSMRINEEQKNVVAGDVILIPPFQEHVLTNLSKSEELEFISVYWEENEKTVALKPHRPTFVTVAPPTPNGDLHLGHLSGPYMASDVYSRFLKMQAQPVYFATGSDDHQSYVPTKGFKLGKAPAVVANDYAASIRNTFTKAKIDIDEYLRPSEDPTYIAYVQAFFKSLVESGKIESRKVESLYCEPCQRTLFEAYVSGNCPHCDTKTNGHGCEACGIINDAIDLKAPKCNQCGTTPSKRVEEKFYFPLSSYGAQLTSYLETVAKNSNLSSYIDRVLRRGLPDVSASFTSNWGIPVGLKNYDGQVIFEWLEMAAGYLYLREKNQLGPDHAFVQFFGCDNGFFYSFFIPALLMAAGKADLLPTAFVTNEFYQLEGLKFSTSRNHAVWAHEILEVVPADAVRYYLAKTRPEGVETNFALADFRSELESDLVLGLENWLQRLETLLDGFKHQAPLARVKEESHRDFHRTVRENVKAISIDYRAESFSLNRVVDSLMTLMETSREFLEKESAFVGTERFETAMALSLAALQAFARAAYPLLPETGKTLLSALGKDVAQIRWDADVNFIEAKASVGNVALATFSKALTGIDRFQMASTGGKPCVSNP